MYTKKVKDFIEENDPTMLGMYWALLWRWTVFIGACYLGVCGVAMIFISLAGLIK